jgi:predicted transcriptional regulator
MAELTKQAAVGLLFKEGIEQKEIARLLKLSEKTVSGYVVSGNLKKKRLQHSIAKKTSEENALIALDHQSKVVRMMAEKLQEGITENMSIEDLKAALIPKGEIDALQKLFTTIKGKELDWSYIVRIIREFIQYVKDKDIELAQDLAEIADEYINDKRRSI